MALRRLTLLVSIMVIVLGINYEVIYPSSSDPVRVHDSFILRALATGRGKDAFPAGLTKRKRHKTENSWTLCHDTGLLSEDEDINRKDDPSSSNEEDLMKHGRHAELYHFDLRKLPRDQLPEQRHDPPNMVTATPAYFGHRQQPDSLLDFFSSRTVERALPYTSEAQHAHTLLSMENTAFASAKLKTTIWNEQDSSVSSEQDATSICTNKSLDGKTRFTVHMSVQRSPQDFNNHCTDRDLPVVQSVRRRFHDQREISRVKVLRSLQDEEEKHFLFSCDIKELLPSGNCFHYLMRIFTSEDENIISFSELMENLRNKSFVKGRKHTSIRFGKKTTNRPEYDLSLVCLCISLLIFTNEDLKQKVIAALLSAFPRDNSVRKLIIEFLQKILGSDSFKRLAFPHDVNKEAANGITHDVKKDHLHFLPNKDSHFGHIPNLLPKRRHCSLNAEVPNLVTDEDIAKNQHTSKVYSWLTDFILPLPRSLVTFSAFPTSFLPSMGSSPQDMSHLGCRLASLSSLPASCDISRVRLAEAGFYYDNSKTSRGASNVHEVICYSCGISYGQWAAGDNPITVHEQLKPNCHHLQSRNSVSPNSMPSMSTNGNLSMACSSTSSGYGSMNEGSSSFPNSSFLSSGNSSSMNSFSQQPSLSQISSSSVSNGHSGPGVGVAAGVQIPTSLASRTDSAMNRIISDDLATDSAAIVPHNVTLPTTVSRPARDSVTLPSSNQSSFLGSCDASHALVHELDDRPPVSMDCAVYPQFSRLQERSATFSTWPLTQQFPSEDLVMQGFYYAGYADCIRCFYCGVGLKSWAEGDDVMMEHIRWRPSCGYILNTKGRRFVNSVLERLQIGSPEEQNNQTNSGSQGSTIPTNNTTTINSRPTTPASTSSSASTGSSASASTTIPSAAASTTIMPSSSAASATSSGSASGENGASTASREVLKTVEDMGFSQELIARAVRQLQQSGVTRIMGDALVEKILEMSSSEDGNHASGSTATAEPSGLETDGPEKASSTTTDAERAAWLASENERLRARHKCKICNNNKVGMIFLPCGHILACTGCGNKTRSCSGCGEVIRATANVYL